MRDILARLGNQSQNGIGMMDQKELIISVNDKFANLHGYKPSDVIGRHISIFHTPEQMSMVYLMLDILQKTSYTTGVLWHVKKSGEIFPTMATSCKVYDYLKQEDIYLGYFQDISRFIPQHSPKELIISQCPEEDQVCTRCERKYKAYKSGNYYSLFLGNYPICPDCAHRIDTHLSWLFEEWVLPG